MRRAVYLVRRSILYWGELQTDVSNFAEGLRLGVQVGRQYRHAVDEGRVSFHSTAGRVRVPAALFARHPRTAVILGAGQSNLANECDPHGHYRPGDGVFNFNFLDGRCYVAQDPLLGSTGDRANLMTRLGDRLVRAGAFDRVLLVSIAHGGTYVAEWAPGGRMNLRLMLTLELLFAAGLEITHILWQQGEAEAASSGDPVAWSGAFHAIVEAVRRRGVTAPIYVAQCTVCCSGPNETVRAAQRSVVDPRGGVLAGPDLDVIGVDDRWDGCHLSARGLDKAAELWHQTLTGAGPHGHPTPAQAGEPSR